MFSCAGHFLKKAIPGAVLPHEIARIMHASTFWLGLGTRLETANGGSAVASTHLPNVPRDRQRVSPPTRPDASCPDLDAILEENKQLRELVVQLSEIVVRNVLDRK
jgi:hypothetical protein